MYYSCRRAVIESSRDARRAGEYRAQNDTRANTAEGLESNDAYLAGSRYARRNNSRQSNPSLFDTSAPDYDERDCWERRFYTNHRRCFPRPKLRISTLSDSVRAQVRRKGLPLLCSQPVAQADAQFLYALDAAYSRGRNRRSGGRSLPLRMRDV
jgi:hypothetical protein